MIPKRYIAEWRKKAPWREDWHVEQDLVIERALIEIFSDDFLKDKLAFRGGTALHKIYLQPQSRYSEDIDLVQINAEPIRETFKVLRERLSFLGTPVVKQKRNNNTMVFRFNSESEPSIPMKLKVEINCREHFTIFGHTKIPLKLDSLWFSGESNVITFSIEELLGTKLRALYQRKKGRDLFDMWYALTQTNANPSKIIEAFNQYLQKEQKHISKKQFVRNMELKMMEKDFINDIEGLLRPGMEFNHEEAYELVMSKIIENL